MHPQNVFSRQHKRNHFFLNGRWRSEVLFYKRFEDLRAEFERRKWHGLASFESLSAL